jgi:hypothetical protein
MKQGNQVVSKEGRKVNSGGLGGGATEGKRGGVASVTSKSLQPSVTYYQLKAKHCPMTVKE